MSNERPTAPGPGGLVPRHGMYAGANYTGGQAWGAHQLPSEQAWKVPPIGYLDDVTRTHDIKYTYIEQTYQGTDPASQAARTQALWQADKEMLVNMLQYQPQNWLEAQYRSAAVQAFVAKADLSYRKHVDVVGEWNRDLAGIDPRFPAMPVTEDGRANWNGLGLVHARNTYVSTGMEALSTSGVNLQAALLFNTHIRPGHMDQLNDPAHRGETYDPLAAQDFSRRILVPQRDPINEDIFTAEGYIDGKRVTIHYDSDRNKLVRTTYNGEQIESETTYAGEPDTGLAGLKYGHANFTVTRQDYANGEPVGAPTPLPPVKADAVPVLAESSHTRAISGLVTQGETAVYPAAPTHADKAWHAGDNALFTAKPESANEKQPPESGSPPAPGKAIPNSAPPAAEPARPAAQAEPAASLSPICETLLDDARREVQGAAQRRGLAWEQGLENTVWSVAAQARQSGLTRVEMLHAEAGQIRLGQLDWGVLREAALDARQAANTPPEQSAQALRAADQQAQAHAQALALEREQNAQLVHARSGPVMA